MKARGLLAASSAVLLVAACGVPTDERPQTIPRDDVPFDILVPSTAPSARGGPATGSPVQLFFVRGERLAAVPRQVSGPVTLRGVLDALVVGPTPAEAASGLRSAIRPQTRVINVALRDGVAQIDLSTPFAGVEGEDQVPAVGQLVYACTQLPGVSGLQLLVDGERVEVPTEEGKLTSRPLRRTDFPKLAPA
ncbi:MAG: GerMN domain-containing protein [Actinomycetota bacterium]|nr:GerMN domain-containing protein [Actinomycetota bacterium]